MKESVTENVLEGIVGFTAVIAILMPLLGVIWVLPSEGLAGVPVFNLFFILPIITGILFLYKLLKRKIGLASLLILIYFVGHILIFPAGQLGLLFIVLIILTLMPLISGIILLLQAFDIVPVEEKGEIKI